MSENTEQPDILPKNQKTDNFIQAFHPNYNGCRHTCHCGREFWDGYNSGYTWEDGEVEALEKNPNATRVGYCVETIVFEGREYASDCTCWHPRAKQITGFIDAHASKIAAYLNLEKKRKQAVADNAPTVE